MTTMRLTPRRSTPKIYEKALTARHPWVEGHTIRIGTSRVPANDIPAYTASLRILCEKCPLRIQKCPGGIVPAVRKAYFAPICRQRLPRLSQPIYEVLLDVLTINTPDLPPWRFGSHAVDMVRRWSEASVRRRLPDLKAENSLLRIENGRLKQEVRDLKAALRAARSENA